MKNGYFRTSVMLFVFVSFVAVAQTASADSFVVRSGGYWADYGDPPRPWRFAGDGFEFNVAITGADTFYWGPFVACDASGCAAGTAVDMSTRILDFTGEGTGATGPLFYSGDLNFAAPTVMAAGGSNGFLEATFQFSGHLTAFSTASRTGTAVFDADLTGTGNASTILGTTLFQDGKLHVEAIGFAFADSVAPTPEPSTLFLLGSGCVGVVLRRRRSVRNQLGE